MPVAGATPDAILPPGLTLAVQDDRLPVVPEDGIAGRLDLLAATGVTVTRVDVLWDQVAPQRPDDAGDPGDPAYRWGRSDAVVDGLAARGIAAVMSVYRPPAWANGGRGGSWAPDPDAYGAFMTALARRYDGRSADADGRVHGPVEIFEPWNEPNIPRFLQPQWRRDDDGAPVPASPAIYAELVRRAWAAVKAVQPDAWIAAVSGAPSGSDNPPAGSVGIVHFVRDLVPLAPPADAWAQHLYTATSPGTSTAMPSYRRLDDLLAELDAVRPGLPLLVTEFGWTTAGTGVRPSHVTEQEQEADLREAVDMLAANPRVRLAVWFNLEDNAEWTSGLRRADGTTKPVWDTFVALPKLVPAASLP
ncbi:MAG TPA: cellulase family glycosylhydrolase [Miltoncostaea sp.]|nr:cellulase family glycosylhydrolase [Miltoncostaea sp.]